MTKQTDVSHACERRHEPEKPSQGGLEPSFDARATRNRLESVAAQPFDPSRPHVNAWPRKHELLWTIEFLPLELRARGRSPSDVREASTYADRAVPLTFHRNKVFGRPLGNP